jgi:hypothetical protein
VVEPDDGVEMVHGLLFSGLRGFEPLMSHAFHGRIELDQTRLKPDRAAC